MDPRRSPLAGAASLSSFHLLFFSAPFGRFPVAQFRKQRSHEKKGLFFTGFAWQRPSFLLLPPDRIISTKIQAALQRYEGLLVYPFVSFTGYALRRGPFP